MKRGVVPHLLVLLKTTYFFIHQRSSQIQEVKSCCEELLCCVWGDVQQFPPSFKLLFLSNNI